MKKKIFKILLLVFVLTSFCACGKKEEVVEKKPKEEKKEEKVEQIKIIDENSNTRPYAVMINTHNEALPQSGLQNAYIVYELMVERGITRMMALFIDV